MCTDVPKARLCSEVVPERGVYSVRHRLLDGAHYREVRVGVVVQEQPVPSYHEDMSATDARREYKTN